MSPGRPKRPDHEGPGSGGTRKGAGRKTRLPSGHRVTVYLSPEDIEMLRALGDGNVSAGVRVAIERSSREPE